jgi:hypothetical protein
LSLFYHKNEILSFVAKWIELEDIILNKINQTQKDKYHVFTLICRSYNSLSEYRIVITTGWEWGCGGRRRLDNEYQNTVR